MIFHIEDHRRYRRCARLFQYAISHPVQEFQYLQKEEEVALLACQYLQVDHYFLGKQNDEKEKAIQALNQEEWLVKARFEYHGLRVKIPILHKKETGLDVYFIYLGTQAKSVDMLFYQDCLFVLEGLGFQVNQVYLLYLNSQYTRTTQLEASQLFKKTLYFLSGQSAPFRFIKSSIQPNHKQIFEDLKQMKRKAKQPLVSKKLSKRCFQTVDCPFLRECHPEYEKEPDDSILFYRNSNLRFLWHQQGRKKILEIPEKYRNKQAREMALWKANETPPLYVNQKELKKWLSQLRYPLIAFDMEWDRYSIPAYEGLRPMDVLPFAYSLCIQNQDKKLREKWFLSKEDGRRKLIESLLKEVPKKGTILTFNMLGAEKLRLLELGKQFPEYQKPLKEIMDRMVDVQIPFQQGVVYHQGMRGSWSLKAIMAVLDPSAYGKLVVKNGLEEVELWRKWSKETKANQANLLKKQLVSYSRMDSLALIRIIDWLLALADGKC